MPDAAIVLRLATSLVACLFPLDPSGVRSTPSLESPLPFATLSVTLGSPFWSFASIPCGLWDTFPPLFPVMRHGPSMDRPKDRMDRVMDRVMDRMDRIRNCRKDRRSLCGGERRRVTRVAPRVSTQPRVLRHRSNTNVDHEPFYASERRSGQVGSDPKPRTEAAASASAVPASYRGTWSTGTWDEAGCRSVHSATAHG